MERNSQRYSSDQYKRTSQSRISRSYQDVESSYLWELRRLRKDIYTALGEIRSASRAIQQLLRPLSEMSEVVTTTHSLLKNLIDAKLSAQQLRSTTDGEVQLSEDEFLKAFPVEVLAIRSFLADFIDAKMSILARDITAEVKRLGRTPPGGETKGQPQRRIERNEGIRQATGPILEQSTREKTETQLP
jgi:hypothetical protein